MREIKFRAWDAERKILREVYNLHFNGYPIEGVCGCDVLRTDNSNYEHWILTEEIKIMQWTGLKDKNGTDIYESDLVKAYDKIYQIEFNLGSFLFINKKYRLDWRFVCNNADDFRNHPDVMDQFEVISNIYQNSDLL